MHHSRIGSTTLLLVALVAFAGCGDGRERDDVDAEMVKTLAKETPLSEEDAKAMIESFGGAAEPGTLPPGWRPLRDGMWAGPMSENGFAPNVNVLHGSASAYGDDATPQDLLAADEGASRYLSKGRYQRISIGNVTVLGQPGRRLESVSTIGKQRMHVVQYYVIDGEDAFAITGSVDARDWDEFGPAVEDVMRSFRRTD